MNKIGAILTVYNKSPASEFKKCLKSLFSQTYPYDEIIVVVDGPIGRELHGILNEFASKECFKIYWLKENLGPGAARNAGISACSMDYVSIYDADDSYSYDRNKLTIIALEQFPDVDVIGFYQTEKIIGVGEILKKVPHQNYLIKKGLKFKSTINNTTATIRRSKVLGVGGYPVMRYGEDFILWIRMARSGSKFLNMPYSVADVNLDLDRRSGGYGVLKRQMVFVFTLLKEYRFMNVYAYVRGVSYIVMWLMPTTIRQFLFKKTRS